MVLCSENCNDFDSLSIPDKVDIISDQYHCFKAMYNEVNDEGAADQQDVNKTSILGHSDTKVNSLVFTAPPSTKGVSIPVYDNCISGKCDCKYLLGGSETQLKPCRFAAVLFDTGRNATDDELKMYNGIVDGFGIISNVVEGYDNANYLSILSDVNKPKMDKIVNREISNGILEVVDEKPICIHALGAVDKPDGGIRPITDCSLPSGRCINDNVDDLVQSFSYKSVDDVVKMVNHGDFITVVDIKSAYRAVSIDPSHVQVQGLRWEIQGEQKFLVDKRLCFGLRCAPYYFNLISEFFFNVLTERYSLRVVNYLDDFAALGASYEECLFAQSTVIYFLRYLGFHISWNKITAPSQCAVYLGIIIDTSRMELRLPECKVQKTLNMLRKVGNSKCISRKNLECLTGLLAHCATVVRGGRTFCRRLYNLHKYALQKRIKLIRLGNEAREDISWWLSFIRTFNGKSAIKKPECTEEMVSDSSKKGFAVHFGTDWAYGSWDSSTLFDSECNHLVSPPMELDSLDRDNINVLELYPVVVGIQRWGPACTSRKITVVTDNLQVFHMVRTGRSVNSRCMQWLRVLFWHCVQYDLDLEPKYIRSEDNIIADTLSRVGYKSTTVKLASLLEPFEICCKDVLIEFFRSFTGGSQETEADDNEVGGGTVYMEESQEPVEVL